MASAAGKYHGLTLGAIRRNSTGKQKGNYRAEKQLVSVEEHVVRNDGRIVLYDEQGTSGRRLSHRPVARGLLRDVVDGLVDGIAVDVLDRLTRDELGEDAGAMARVLVQARAVLVTPERDYRLWLKADLLMYRMLTGLAGVEVLSIRDSSWDGIFTRARHEPFFQGMPPFGYTTRPVDGLIGGADSQRRLRRVPVRDELLAPIMAALAQAFDTCLTLTEVCQRLNQTEYLPIGRRGPDAGRPIAWDRVLLVPILRNPIYGGQWALCWQSKRESAVWDGSSTDEPRRRQSWSIDAPALAWFTAAQLERWRQTFLPAGPEPKMRRRTYDRPLRGVFLCAGCQRPMTAQGKLGYGCPQHSNKQSGLGCPSPQWINHDRARALLRQELPLLLAERADYRDRLARQVQAEGNGDRRLKLREELAAGLAAMERQWCAPDSPYVLPDGVVQRMSDLKRQINQLSEQLERDARRPALTAADQAILANVATNMAAWWVGLSDEEEYGLLRRAIGDVRFEAGSRGAGRWYRIVSRTNRLLNA